MTRYTSSTSTTGAVRCTFDPETEPNFYAMPPLPSCQASTSAVPAASDPNEISHGSSCGPVSLTDCLQMNMRNGLYEVGNVGSHGRTRQEDSWNISQANPSAYQQRHTGQVAYPRMLSLRDGLSLSSKGIPQDGEAMSTNSGQQLASLPASGRTDTPSYMALGPRLEVPVCPRQRLRHNDSQANNDCMVILHRIPNEQSYAALAHSLRSVGSPVNVPPPQFCSPLLDIARHDDTVLKARPRCPSPATSTPNRSLNSVPDHGDAALVALFDTLLAAIPDSYPYPSSPGMTRNDKSQVQTMSPFASVSGGTGYGQNPPLLATLPTAGRSSRVAAQFAGFKQSADPPVMASNDWYSGNRSASVSSMRDDGNSGGNRGSAHHSFGTTAGSAMTTATPNSLLGMHSAYSATSLSMAMGAVPRSLYDAGQYQALTTRPRPENVGSAQPPPPLPHQILPSQTRESAGHALAFASRRLEPHAAFAAAAATAAGPQSRRAAHDDHDNDSISLVQAVHQSLQGAVKAAEAAPAHGDESSDVTRRFPTAMSTASSPQQMDLFDDQSILSNDGSLSQSCGSTSSRNYHET